MQHHMRFGLILGLASLLPTVSLAPAARAQESKGNAPTSWCSAATMYEAIATNSVRSAHGTVTAIDAATGIIRITAEYRIATVSPESTSTKSSIETKTKAVDVVITPQTSLQRAIARPAPPDTSSPAGTPAKEAPANDSAKPIAATSIQYEAIKLADIRVGQDISVAAIGPISIPTFKINCHGEAQWVVTPRSPEPDSKMEANFIMIHG